MPPYQREDRVNNGLESLINAILPSAASADRKKDAFDLAKEILEDQGDLRGVNVNLAGDLIKKDLIRNQRSPDRALQFSSLYSRLITQPILNQKWAILYFLRELSPAVTGENERQAQQDEGESSEEDYAAAAGQESAVHSPKAVQSPKAVTSPRFLRAKPPASPKEKKNPEPLILRDLPFALQGISSANFDFSPNGSVHFRKDLDPAITGLLYTFAEPAMLYKSLTTFGSNSENGLLRQSLCSALDSELRSYLKVVSTLEGRIRQASQSSEQAVVTLRKCAVWLREPTMGLRLLAWIAEESKGKKGGQIISLIHGLSLSHGDPMIGTYAERLLSPITRPFYDMLKHWIYDGELSDPFHEFFVSEQDPSTIKSSDEVRGRGAASSVWEDKYKLDHDMIPSIITEEFSQKVFLIGKSLNFIRHGCSDSIWVEQYSKAASKELRYGDTEMLETWIDEAYKTTMARLIHLMAEKFHLFQHLKALKDYILLGQGDFIALLMESLSANLDRPAGAQYRHTLTAQLEHAIRGSNAQYDSPEVLRRLDARMLQLSHGDIGWDCFTLEYKIDAPVDVIVTDWGNRQYLKVFNFLWRIKRVEFVLATTWRKCMTGARGVLQSVDPAVAQAWKVTRGAVGEMIHFISQLQYYILFEVIESSWDELQVAIHKEGCTLDDIIKAHTKYLNAITHKGLLGAKKSRIGEGDENAFLGQLGDILRTMLSYRDAVDGLYSWSVAEFTRKQEASVRAETMLGEAESEGDRPNTPKTSRRGPKHLATDSINNTPMPGAIPSLLGHSESADDLFSSLAERLKSLDDQFKGRVSMLLADLAHQPDTDMRFLGVVMNFNDYYQLTRRRPKGKEAAKAK